MPHWCATVFCQVFGDTAARLPLPILHEKGIDWAKGDLNHRGKPTMD
jgi:hypothetical protein